MIEGILLFLVFYIGIVAFINHNELKRIKWADEIITDSEALQELRKFIEKPDRPVIVATPRDSPPTHFVKPMYMSAESKREYLCSVAWQALKKQRLDIDNYSCQVCGCTFPLEVHHTTYERLGAEDIQDLKTVCRTCHQLIHNKLGYSRTTKYPV